MSDGFQHGAAMDNGVRLDASHPSPNSALNRAERELPESLRGVNLLESIDDGFAAFNAEWRFTYVNRNAERLLSRSGESLIGKVFWDEYPALIGSESERIYRRVMEERVPGESEEYYAPLNGWFEGRYFPSPDGGIFVLFRNITARKLQRTLCAPAKKVYGSLNRPGSIGIWCFDLAAPERNYWSAETYVITGLIGPGSQNSRNGLRRSTRRTARR